MKCLAVMACHMARDSGIPQLSMSEHDLSPQLADSYISMSFLISLVVLCAIVNAFT